MRLQKTTLKIVQSLYGEQAPAVATFAEEQEKDIRV